VPGAGHTPVPLGPAQTVHLLTGGVESLGERGPAELLGHMILGQRNSGRVGVRGETVVGPVVLHCRHLGADWRLCGAHAG
jgi:hypothetical protein